VKRQLARKIADAVLYEGYMLYPYRPSAIKNRQRWTFGILYPPAYIEVASGTERSTMHSECLLQTTDDAATLQIQLRFLHLIARQVAKSPDDGSDTDRFQPVPSLVVDDHLVESWDEGTERSVEFAFSILADPQQLHFRFPGSTETELLRDNSGYFIGKVTRTQREVTGVISVSSDKVGDHLMKLTIDIANTTQSAQDDPTDRNSALLRSLLSAHTILTTNHGEFVSLLDPPDNLRDAVKQCHNVGNFPVLVGAPPERDMLLCSPIVLYDYPQIAPESATDFYDATEMDEMLTLRIMTLTADEKNEMRHADDRVRGLLRRTEQSAREQLMRTHGVIRGMSPVSEKP
jgi:hydrogenase maturation protease